MPEYDIPTEWDYEGDTPNTMWLCPTTAESDPDHGATSDESSDDDIDRVPPTPLLHALPVNPPDVWNDITPIDPTPLRPSSTV